MASAPFFINTEDGFVTDVIESFGSQNTFWKFHKNVRWAKPFSSFEEADGFMKLHSYDRYYTGRNKTPSFRAGIHIKTKGFVNLVSNPLPT